MNDTKESPAPDTRHGIEILRWLAVLPAAILASWAGALVGLVFYQLISIGGTTDPRAAGWPDAFLSLMYYFPNGAAYTFAGAMIAPRRQILVAIILTVCRILMSLQVHVIGQSNPGTTNYMHSAGDSLGAIMGAAAVLYVVLRIRNRSAGQTVV